MTPANFIDCEQGSQMWAELRCGIVTASRCSDVIAMTKKGEEKAERRNYRSELICERLTGIPYPQSAQYARAVLWGKEHESDARATYELKMGVLVDVMGFVMHPTIDRFGCSPDFLVGDVGMGQIKCPDTATHIEWIRQGTVPLEHVPQMLAEMACCERDWCDFVSYDPRLPEHLQLFVRRLPRDPKFIAILEGEVAHFNRQIDETIASLPEKPQGIVLSMDNPNSDEVDF